MIDALLYGCLDAVRQMPYGWDNVNSDVMPDGHPPPRTAEWFLAFHQVGERGTMMNALNELYDFVITMTCVVSGVPIDRTGDKLLFSRLARTLAIEKGMNARVEQLKTFFHMNWWVIGLANDYLVKMYTEASTVNGFCEPMQWANTEPPKLVGGEWLGADPESPDAALVTEIYFKDARRLQPIATYT